MDDSVVEKVAGIAAREVDGVDAMGGGLGRTLADLSQRVGLGDQRGQGVSVDVGEQEAAVDVTTVVSYGNDMQRVARAIRDHVIEQIEFITGLRVTEVSVTISDVSPRNTQGPPSPRAQ